MRKGLAYLSGLKGAGPGVSHGGRQVRVEVCEGVFALHQCYTTRARGEVPFEAHRKYIDLQCVLSGSEVIRAAPPMEREGGTPYDPERDIAFFDREGGVDLFMTPGVVAVFFPGDLHAPGISLAVPAEVVKVVVKVEMDLP